MKHLLQWTVVSCTLLILWQLTVVVGHLPDFILPAPAQVFVTLYHQIDLIAYQSLLSLIETLIGFIFGVALGCCAGLMIAYFRPLSFWFLPMLIISQAVPTFAIAPLFVIWFGYGMGSKIAITIVMIFFPVASAFYDGLKRANPEALALAKTMNAKKWRIFWFIRIPAALPTLASGIRIAAVIAPIGAIVGEWVGSSQGLGYLMLNANARMEIDMMFAALLVIIIFSLVLYFSVDKLLRILIWWE